MMVNIQFKKMICNLPSILAEVSNDMTSSLKAIKISINSLNRVAMVDVIVLDFLLLYLD